MLYVVFTSLSQLVEIEVEPVLVPLVNTPVDVGGDGRHLQERIILTLADRHLRLVLGCLLPLGLLLGHPLHGFQRQSHLLADLLRHA